MSATNLSILPVRAIGLGILLTLILSCSVAAQDVRIEVDQAFRAGVSGRDGGAVTIPFQITVKAAAMDSLTDHVAVPSMWSVAGRQGRFLPPESGRLIRLATILIPRGTPSGAYQVRYSLKSADGRELDSLRVPIRVASRYTWQLRTFEPSLSLVAGRDLEATFLLSNTGNTPLGFRLKAAGPESWRVQLDSNNVQLLPGEQRVLSMGISAPVDLTAEENVSFMLQAHPREVPDSMARATVRVHVLPRASRIEPRFHVLPLLVQIGGGGMRRFNQGSSPFIRLGLSGGGPLAEKGSARMGVDAQVPAYGESYVNDLDRYTVRLDGKTTRFMAGDVNARMSALYGSYIYGFGAYTAANLRYIEISGLGLTDRRNRFFSEKHAGGRLTVFPVKALGVGGGYLTRESYYNSGQVFSVIAALRPNKQIQLESEYGKGRDKYDRSSQGISLTAGIQYPRFSTVLEYLEADPAFPTSIQGERRIVGRADIIPVQKLRVSTNYWVERNRPDSLYSDQEWFSRSYYLRADYAGWMALQYSASDSRLNEGTDLRSSRNAARVELSRRSRRSYLNASMEVGRFAGRSLDRSSLVWTSGLNTTFYLGQAATIYGQAYLQNGPMGAFSVSEKDQRMINGMLGTSFTLFKKLQIEGSYFVSTLLGDLSFTSHMIRTRVDYTLPWQHRLRLTQDFRVVGTRGNIGQVSVNYLVPLNIRLQRSKRFGYVEGRIYDQRSGEVIRDLPVYLNGMGTVTNDDGRFYFTDLRPGTYRLTLDREARANTIVPTDSSVLAFELEGGKTHELPVAVVRTASISGEVLLVDSTGATVQRLSGIPVTVKGNTDQFTLVSDGGGRFQVIHLRPGTYSVALVPNTFDANYELVRESAQVTIRGGEQQEVQLSVKMRRRRIRFMNQTGNFPRRD